MSFDFIFSYIILNAIDNIVTNIKWTKLLVTIISRLNTFESNLTSTIINGWII